MRIIVKIGTALVLFAVSACSPPIYSEALIVEEPMVSAEPAAPVAGKMDCGTADIGDGIGGTGCPTPIE